MHDSIISFAILIARGKFVPARTSHRVSASMIESGSLANARACISTGKGLSIPSDLDQYDDFDFAVAYDAEDIVSATELADVAKLKFDADDSLDSKSSSTSFTAGRKYGDVGD